MQLICEGACNYGRVQGIDDIIRKVNRAHPPDERVPRLSEPEHLALAHSIKHTEHEPVRGSTVFFTCLSCGTVRRYGWIEPVDRFRPVA